MTALASSPVFWIGLLADPATLCLLPVMIAVIRQIQNIALVLLNCFPVAWPAASSSHA